MAKVSITNKHDYMRFIINFGGDVQITGNFNRYQHTIKVSPYHGPTTRAVSEAIDYVMETSVKSAHGINPGQLFDIIKPAGELAKTPEQFIEFFKSEIEKVHGIVVRAFDAERREEPISEVSKDGRGWRMTAHLENGDCITVKSSGRTVSLNMTPPITGLMAEAASLAMGYVQLGADSKALADVFAEHAMRSRSTEEWIESCRMSIAPADVVKR
jgi:hypothetical protein